MEFRETSRDIDMPELAAMIDERVSVLDGESAESAFAEAPSRVEDPVRAYLHEIGKVRLLTAAQEVAIGRRIEVGQTQLWGALAEIPLVVQALADVGDKLRRGEIPPTR